MVVGGVPLSLRPFEPGTGEEGRRSGGAWSAGAPGWLWLGCASPLPKDAYPGWSLRLFRLFGRERVSVPGDMPEPAYRVGGVLRLIVC